MRMVLSLVVMVVLAQLSPRTYESLAPLMFVAGVVLLFGVLFFGEASKGAQRWLNLGFVRFQPSELLKLAVPLMVALYRSPTITTNIPNADCCANHGVLTNDSYRETTRFGNVDSDCGFRYFRYFPSRHQLEDHRSGCHCLRWFHTNFVVLLDARIPKGSRSYSVQSRI